VSNEDLADAQRHGALPIEMFMRGLRRELLDRLLIINQRQAATALRQHERRYNMWVPELRHGPDQR